MYIKFPVPPRKGARYGIIVPNRYKKVKAKTKTMSHNLPSYAALRKKLYLHVTRFINLGNYFFIIALSKRRNF